MDILSSAEEEELDKWVVSQETIDLDNATKALKEIKQIFDSLGVTFFLRQGTCLGAVRDQGLLPWDDDVDVGSVIGLHDFSEESINDIVTTFRNNGFLTRIEAMGPNPYIPLVKYSTRVDWACFRIVDDHIVQFPFQKTPLGLFTDLKEITFLDEQFCVPNPPEEYLRLKYGNDWTTPKRTGYFEEDVLTQVAKAPAEYKVGKIRHLLARYTPWMPDCKMKILDDQKKPVSGAEVTVVGLGNFRTDKQGNVRFYLPQNDFYPLVIRYRDYEHTNYLQRIEKGKEYVFGPDE